MKQQPIQFLYLLGPLALKIPLIFEDISKYRVRLILAFSFCTPKSALEAVVNHVMYIPGIEFEFQCTI